MTTAFKVLLEDYASDCRAYGYNDGCSPEPDDAALLRYVTKLEAERDELRARLAETEAQEPVAADMRPNGCSTWHRFSRVGDAKRWIADPWPGVDEVRLLYARPAPAIPAGAGMPTASMAAASAYTMGWNDCRAEMVNAAPEPKA